MRFEVGSTWQGESVKPIVVVVDESGVGVEAPFYGQDPVPEGSGHHPRLWEFEVVEVFLGAEDGSYVEIELGPHGHWLVLAFAGYRDQVELGEVVSGYRVERVDGRWSGKLVLEPAWWRSVLATSRTGNAYAIHTAEGRRRYCAAFVPTDGSRPDFHRQDVWRSLTTTL